MHLFGEPLRAVDQLVDQVGELEALEGLQGLCGHLLRKLAGLVLTRAQEPLDQLDARGALAIHDELHAEPGASPPSFSAGPTSPRHVALPPSAWDGLLIARPGLERSDSARAGSPADDIV